MKTIAKTNKENRVQQVVLKTLAVLISLVLLTYTINAQGMWETAWEDASLAMKTYTTENSEVMYAANFANKEADNTMELEHWMTDSRHFIAHVELEAETEDVLEIEPWMTNAAYFSATENVALETEEALELESWMVSDNFGAVKDSMDNNSKSKVKKASDEQAVAQNISVENREGNNIVKAKNFTYRELKEPALKFERWMFDRKHFTVKNN